MSFDSEECDKTEGVARAQMPFQQEIDRMTMRSIITQRAQETECYVSAAVSTAMI